jgi:hypothetical protein
MLIGLYFTREDFALILCSAYIFMHFYSADTNDQGLECCVFFWVMPRRLNFISRRFGTLYLFHLHMQEGE